MARSSSEELPEYEEHAPGLQVVPHSRMDLDEGIAGIENDTQPFSGGGSLGDYHRDTPNWSFENLGNDEDDESTQFVNAYPSGAAGPSSMRGVSRPVNQQEAMDSKGGFDDDENLFEDDNASMGRPASSRSDEGPGLGDASDDEGSTMGQPLRFRGTSERENSPAAANIHVPAMRKANGMRHGEAAKEEDEEEDEEDEEDKVVDIRVDAEEGDGA